MVPIAMAIELPAAPAAVGGAGSRESSGRSAVDRPRICATICNHLRTADSRASAQKFAWRSMAVGVVVPQRRAPYSRAARRTGEPWGATGRVANMRYLVIALLIILAACQPYTYNGNPVPYRGSVWRYPAGPKTAALQMRQKDARPTGRASQKVSAPLPTTTERIRWSPNCFDDGAPIDDQISGLGCRLCTIARRMQRSRRIYAYRTPAIARAS